MLGLTCEADCPDVSWDFVEIQLIMFGGLWGMLLIVGWGMAFYTITSDVDDFREKVEVLQGRIQSSKWYVTLCTALAIFQCVIFSARTFSKSVDGMSFLVEIVACCLFFFNFILAWLSKGLHGFIKITPFMFSRAFIDALMFPSVICLMIIEVDGSKGWFSFSFVSALHILECWRWNLDIRRINLQEMTWQIVDVSVNIIVLVFFSAMMMMTLENLGDPSWLKDVNDTEWNTVSAVYYVFVTISTVGYGDLAPVTGLGRLFAVVTIFGGISSLVLAMYKILNVMNIHSSGGGHFTPRMTSRHIVVTGNPTTAMALDFIAELFHEDHADDCEDLHVVFLLPRGTRTMSNIQKEMKQRKNVHIAPRVHAFQGSVLEKNDLHRVAPMQATAVFVLPNLQCRDYMHEDTEDIIRMMAVLKINPQVRLILLLMKAENQQLLNESGAAHGSNITCLAIDQFKLELVGKSCQVPGFATLICNLFKTIADSGEEDYSLLGAWLQDYDKGTGNEIYEVELSATYSQRGAVFSEVVLDVIEQTDGAVYLIGLVEASPGLGTNRVIVNPGTWYPIKDAKTTGMITSGIFIAADRETVQQCEGGVFLGRRDRPDGGKSGKRRDNEDGDREFKRRLTRGAEQRVERTINGEQEKAPTQIVDMQDVFVDPLEDMIRRDPNLTKEMQASARNLIQLAKRQRKASEPARMPLKQLATGGHILFLCIGVRDGEELRLGAEHFLKPLRGGHDSLTHPELSLLILAPVPPRDWHRCSEDKKVFYMRGSPLSLFDLERANFRHAAVIIICHVGSPRNNLSEAWMVDSDIVCCARLIESELPPNSPTSVIAEIAVDTNHPFIPLPGLTALGEPKGPAVGLMTNVSDAAFMPAVCFKCGHRCEEGALCCEKCGAVPVDEHDTSGIGIKKSDKRMSFGFGAAATPQINEYYRQARYACGQLFVGNVITSLTVNTFYNPSLWELVHQMIKAEVVMVSLPRDWEGKSYYEYFDKLLREDELMAVAVYRRAEAKSDSKNPKAKNKGGRKWSYIFTAPPAKETHMQRGDSVICFASAFKIRQEDLEIIEDKEKSEAIDDLKVKSVSKRGKMSFKNMAGEKMSMKELGGARRGDAGGGGGNRGGGNAPMMMMR
jgi:hypothetical protein